MLFGIHFLLAMSWAIFLLSFIKSIQTDSKDKYLFGILSVVVMVAILVVGTKMMLLDHSIVKSGFWIHSKLLIDIFLMLENLFLLFVLFKKKEFSDKFYTISYWVSYVAFMVMVWLTMFRPF